MQNARIREIQTVVPYLERTSFGLLRYTNNQEFAYVSKTGQPVRIECFGNIGILCYGLHVRLDTRFVDMLGYGDPNPFWSPYVGVHAKDAVMPSVVTATLQKQDVDFMRLFEGNSTRCFATFSRPHLSYVGLSCHAADMYVCQDITLFGKWEELSSYLDKRDKFFTPKAEGNA